MSVENKSVGINSETHEVIKYCVECERKCPKSCEFALPVKKVRFNFNFNFNFKFTYNFCLTDR